MLRRVDVAWSLARWHWFRVGVFPAATAVLVSSCAPSEEMVSEAGATEDVEAVLVSMTDSIIAAAERLDIDAILALGADHLMADQGRLHTQAEVAEAYREGYGTLEGQEIERTRTVVTPLGPDVAMMVAEGTYIARRTDGSEGRGRWAWSSVWQNADGSWRYVQFHQSLEREDEAQDTVEP